MKDRDVDMKMIFEELSEKNKDIVILIARSMKVAQENTGQFCAPQGQAVCKDGEE